MNVRSRRFELLGGVVVVGAAVALGLTAGGAGPSPDAAEAGSRPPRADRTIAGGVKPSAKPEPVAAPRHERLALPRHGTPVLYVRDGHRAVVRTSPGGRVVKRVGPRTEFGSRTVFSVVRRERRWAGVVTPLLANGELGWVRLDPARLGAYRSDWSLDVDLTTRQAAVRRRGELVRSFAVTVGAPGTDTPTGRFAITDTFRGGLNPAYGCCAAALSAHQPKLLSGWLGGSRIAIHGTTGPLGLAVSHGCIRAADEDISAIVSHVPIGTPVIVHS